MNSVVDPETTPTITDSVLVELHSTVSPYNTIASKMDHLHTNGTGTFTFPGMYVNNYYYVVLKHRNSIETWSKLPVFLPPGGSSYNFSIPGAVQRMKSPDQNEIIDGQ